MPDPILQTSFLPRQQSRTWLWTRRQRKREIVAATHSAQRVDTAEGVIQRVRPTHRQAGNPAKLPHDRVDPLVVDQQESGWLEERSSIEQRQVQGRTQTRTQVNSSHFVQPIRIERRS